MRLRSLPFFLIMLMIFAWSTAIRAEEIVLTNGDKITGEVISETEKSLTVQTQAMGLVTIEKQYVKVQELVEEKSLWTRTISVGFSQAGGNTEKAQGTSALKFNRKTDDDELTIKADAYYSSSNQEMDAKKFYGMGRYAFSFGNNLKWYNFYKAEGSQDRFANIDYRITPALGVGYWFSDRQDFKAMVEGAAGFEHTNFRGTTKSTNEGVLVPRAFLEKQILENLRISEDITLYPSLSETGEFRLRSETALTSKITQELSWKVSFLDEYDSDPTGSSKKNDYRVITSLDYEF